MEKKKSTDGNKLPSIKDWVRGSFKLYANKENFIYLTKFALLQLLVTGALYIILLPISFSLFSTGEFNPLTPQFALIALAFFVFFFFNLWLYIATLKAVAQVAEGGARSVKMTLTSSIRRMLPFIGASILMGIIVILGLVLLIIPGLIFIVWLYFTQYLVIVENISPVSALKRSKAMVKGHFRAVVGRIILMFLYFWVIGTILSIVLFPLAQIIVVTIITPYYTLVPYLLYRDLKNLKPSVAE